MKIIGHYILAIITIGSHIRFAFGQGIVAAPVVGIPPSQPPIVGDPPTHPPIVGGPPTAAPPAVDVRFNKFNLTDASYSDLLPLGSNRYPISNHNRVTTMLKLKTNAASVVNHKTDNEVSYNVSDLIASIGGLPDHPSSNLNAPYWKKLNQVIDMRVRCINKRNKLAKNHVTDVMQLPLRWANYTMNDLAESVHDEYPGLHQSEFIADLTAGKYGYVEYDDDIVPLRATKRFLRGIIMLSDLNTWSIGKVGPHNFGAKWYAGRARPEEVAYKIFHATLIAPKKTTYKIKSFPVLIRPTDFTHYPEGSPTHPSWPAMHSAASNISFWLQVILNMTPRQLCEAQKVDYAVAYARTIAGVHFEDDNIAGLKMGQKIMSKAFPKHLKKKYKSNSNTVKRKVQQKVFDWGTYNPLTLC